MNPTHSERQWRIAGKDEGDVTPDYTKWTGDERLSRRWFAGFMDGQDPPYDEVWTEMRTVAYSEPVRVDG